MKMKCHSAKIKFPEKNFNYISEILSRYLSNSIEKDGFESSDLRFSLTSKRFIHFQSRIRQISMPLNKMIASLALPQNELFQYLTVTSKHGSVKPFTTNEKILLKHFIRLSGIKKSKIPCLKIKNL